MLRIAASETESTSEIQETNSACRICFAPQLRAIIAVAATETPISIAWIRKNTRCPVVTAATEVVPSSATIFMCTNPTVVNNRLEIIVGHASCQTWRLDESGVSLVDADKGYSHFGGGNLTTLLPRVLD